MILNSPKTGDAPADPTETFQENERLRALVAELNVDSALREQFIAILTHDLKTPLASICLQADIVRRETQDPVNLKRMSRIIEQVQRMDRMIQDMLDVSLIRAGKPLPVKRRECDLVLLARELIEELVDSENCSIHLEGSLHARGCWDASHLRRVLTNLLQNAVKYGDARFPITVRVCEREEAVTVSIHNHGNAIPRENQELLFRPYHRSEHARRSGKTGWGLGLTLVKGVIDAHRGTLEMRSDDREGTFFTFALPKNANPAGTLATLRTEKSALHDF